MMENNNTTYKDSPLGKIPCDWEVIKISDYGKVYTGNTPPTNDIENYGHEFLFVSPSDLGSDKYILNTEKKLSRKGFSVSRKFPAGSVLFTCIGSTIGKSGVASVELTSNQQINTIVVDKKYSNEFLYYALESNSHKIKLLAGEQAVPILNKSQFESVRIICPPLPEQKAIARILSLMDSAINTNNQLIAKKELQKKWLMQQLLSVKLIVKNEKWCKSGVRKVTIGEIAKVNMGQSPDSDYYNETHEGLPLIQGNADLKNRLSIERIFTTHITKTCDQGDIIMTVRAPVGTIGISTKKSCIGRGVCALKPINVDPSYFYYLMLNYEETWKRLEQGSTFTAVNSTDIFHFSLFIINSIEEQSAIAQVLQAADKEIQLLKTKTEKLREQKKGLMQQLLTGKKRLQIVNN